jgi:anti-sigma B factor antagonist
MPAFETTSASVEGADVVAVRGEVDFGTAPELKRRIGERVDAGARTVVVDLSAVEFIDSTGLGVLVGALRRLQQAGGTLVVVCPNAEMRRIFGIVGLDNVIPLHDTRENAIASVASPS